MSEPRTQTDVCLCTGLALRFEGWRMRFEIWDFASMPAHATSLASSSGVLQVPRGLT